MLNLRPTSWLAFVLLLAAAQPAGAQHRTLTVEGGDSLTVNTTGSRVALVLGNAAYAHATPLQNAANDAEDMAVALRRTGFTVVVGTDLTREGMAGALDEFTERVEGAEAALVFYAGHGVEVDGRNYLIPVDADIARRQQVRYRSLALDEVMAALDGSGAAFKMVVLDACRNDPFRAWRSAGGSDGWAATAAPTGSLVVYGTGPGQTASDNPRGRNGLFTEALLAELERPGVEVTRMIRGVYQRVRDASGGEQMPWSMAAYGGDFFFMPEVAPAAVPAAPPADVPPTRAAEAASDHTDPGDVVE